MKKFTSADLLTARIEWSGARWTFAYSSAPEMPAEWAEGFRWQDLLGWGSKNETLDLREFRRASLGALGAVAALTMIVLLWPKAETKEDELIPAQFAHVVMRPAAAAWCNVNADAPMPVDAPEFGSEMSTLPSSVKNPSMRA